MISANVCTWELDDPVAAASELACGVLARIQPQKNSIGLLFGDSDADYPAVLAALKEKLGIEIVGCTSMGMLGVSEGYEEFCMTLLVLSGDDCRFHVECSGVITRETADDVITKTYRAGAAALAEPPRMVFALAPRRNDVFLDIYPEILGGLSGGVPVFGGVPSANPGGKELVFANGGAYTDRLVLVFLAGEVHPRFCTCNQFENIAQQSRTVTKARDNILYRVGEETFLEYASSLGLSFDVEADDTRAISFVSHPLLIEDSAQDRDGVPFVRTIGDINLEDGSAILLGKIPQGALMSIGVLRKDEIKRSTEVGIGEMKRIIGGNGPGEYRYSTLLCVSCIGRSLVTAPNVGLEGGLLREAFGGAYQISGFYAWGEICPTSADGFGAHNRGHHETLSICAI